MAFAAMATLLALALYSADGKLLPLTAGLVLATGIGWMDDRSSLGIAPRLTVHATAGAAFDLRPITPNSRWPIC